MSKPWEAGPLQVSENRRYLQNGDQPFFWLADTAWLMCAVLEKEEIRTYLRNRAEKGFTVIQTVLIHMLPGMKSSRTERDVTDPAYWDLVDFALDTAEELGLYLALVPAWNHIVTQGHLNEENIDRYMHFLAQRYGHRSSVIWLLGGDIRGDVWGNLYRRAGTLLKQETHHQLIGFHPFGRTSSSLWFAGEDWLDFHMFQSGHRRYDQVSLGAWDDNRLDMETYFGEDNWRYVQRDLATDPQKPTVDGEPSYEQILHGLHDLSEPYWQAWDVRRYCYWSLFAGAMGHTYGDNSIQQFYQNPLVPGSFGVRYPWQKAMHHAGSEQMGIARRLMESVEYWQGRAAEDLLLSGQKEKYHRVAVFAGTDWIFAYTYLGEEFTLSLSGLMGKESHAWWFNPVSGVKSYLMETTGKPQITVKPHARFTQDNDWVLIVQAAKKEG